MICLSSFLKIQDTKKGINCWKKENVTNHWITRSSSKGLLPTVPFRSTVMKRSLKNDRVFSISRVIKTLKTSEFKTFFQNFCKSFIIDNESLYKKHFFREAHLSIFPFVLHFRGGWQWAETLFQQPFYRINYVNFINFLFCLDKWNQVQVQVF